MSAPGWWRSSPGEPFDRYLQAHVFEPLGMVDTGFSVARRLGRPVCGLLPVPARRAAPRCMDDPETSPYRRLRSYLSGAGGLVSTSADYLRFCQMLLNGASSTAAASSGARPSSS